MEADAKPMSPPPPPKWAFGGPLGSLGLTFALPLVVYYLWWCLDAHGGALFLPTSGEDLLAFLSAIPAPTPTSLLFYACWLGLQVLLQVFLPGKTIQGQPLFDGSRLSYRMNGLLSFWITVVLAVGLAVLGVFPATIFYDQFGPLLSTAILLAFVYSIYLYWHGRRYGAHEAIHGNLIQDFFMGRSLNPRTGRFDHKLFCEARPGLILWVLGNLSIAAKQVELHGSLTVPMILVCACQCFYVADHFIYEPAILTTWDIKHENFGYMLCFGDLVWVPFTYTFQAYYLVSHLHDLPWWGVAGIVALNFAGYAIFRGANIQKHHFRLDPGQPVWGKPAQFLQTVRGSKLLLSGWWGLARHINYLGDLMMALAWCLPCLFDHLVPYIYIIYFSILLILRERRDHAMCQYKYGDDWIQYTKRVRFRILPGVY